METIKAFCKRKNIEVSAKRYGIDALGAMAQGLFCSLLIGTIIKTLGAQLGVPFLTDIGTYAMSVWVAVRQELTDADIIHDWLLVRIVDRSLNLWTIHLL